MTSHSTAQGPVGIGREEYFPRRMLDTRQCSDLTLLSGGGILSAHTERPVGQRDPAEDSATFARAETSPYQPCYQCIAIDPLQLSWPLHFEDKSH
ncbi:unnamed protein product [Nezara viridula]|uniref:Uncharacterized protein n=1 Tax=Nezara viridula TaxID=85310 RepID=A0A9P0EGY5_NEZVI|nr:unnamed protein product [Nezara viridula]